MLKSEEENHDQSMDQEESYNQKSGIAGPEKTESDLTENLEYSPTEGTLDLKEDMSEPQKEKLQRASLLRDVSSIVDSNQQEHHKNRGKPRTTCRCLSSSVGSQDPSDQGNQRSGRKWRRGRRERAR